MAVLFIVVGGRSEICGYVETTGAVAACGVRGRVGYLVIYLYIRVFISCILNCVLSPNLWFSNDKFCSLIISVLQLVNWKDVKENGHDLI
jgi:hypothetical protein